MPESETLSLGPNESVAGRPFTSVDLIDRDLSVLHGMLDDLLRILDEADRGEREVVEHQRIAWIEDGLARRALVCNEEKLRNHPEACVVGFFGDRRTDMDLGPLEDANSAIVAQFRDYPGIISYSSIEMRGGYWANLVLHDDPVDKEYWSRGALHAQAARVLAPQHYRTVRIHSARLTGRVFDSPAIKVTLTKYWDYTEKPQWAAQRELVS